MKFMMMMHTPRGTGDSGVSQWQPEEVTAMTNYMHAFNAELKKDGEFVIAEDLAPPATARLLAVMNRAERTNCTAERNYLLTRAARLRELLKTTS